MISSLHELAAVVDLPRVAEDGTWDRLRSFGVSYLRQRLCALHGHDQLLQFEADRMFLCCTSCGFETPGWRIGENPPRVRAQARARQRRESFRRVSGDRRIA
jgi:hypothetical protein